MVISSRGFKSQTVRMQVQSGLTDTLVVVLEKEKRSLMKKWWAWGSGVVLGAAILISQIGGGEAEEPKEAGDLPQPPERP